MKITKVLVGMVVMAMLTLSACKKDKDKDDDDDNNPAGTFKVEMTDAPGDYSALNVEITKVEVYKENSGWINLNGNTQNINVLSLTNGTETTIASSTSLESGTYSKVRLTFGTNGTINLHGQGSAFTLGFNSEDDKQVEVQIDENFNSSSSTTVLLDFDVARSVSVVNDDYLLDPVITEIDDENTGVKGRLEGSVYANIRIRKNLSLSDAQSTYTDNAGNFLVRGIEDGTYSLIIQPRQQDVDNNKADEEITISNVTIVQGEIKDLGTIDVTVDE